MLRAEREEMHPKIPHLVSKKLGHIITYSSINLANRFWATAKSELLLQVLELTYWIYNRI